MRIRYDDSAEIDIREFRDILERSTLGERRPIGSELVLSAMLKHADLVCTAWDQSKLVGVARSVTDFEYCCYLSDLAVDKAYQRRGIGKELIRMTQALLGTEASLILLAAPKAADYYPALGFEKHGSAWVIPSRKSID